MRLKYALRALSFVAASLYAGGAAHAEQTSYVYGGAGANNQSSSSTSSAMPWVIGGIAIDSENGSVIGFDIAGEGTKIDNTWSNVDAIQQGISYNLILGKTSDFGADTSLIFGGLVGLKVTEAYCADSYLGFRCYADATPSRNFAINFGGLIGLTFGQTMVAARVTQDSTQALVGFSF